GRPADALPVDEEAVEIRRELAATYPDRYRHDLAASLTNLGITYSEVGRPADALPVTAQAVAIYRELAVQQPERFREPYQRLTDMLRMLILERDDLD
ncbi:tetratricopeptide repeat protein, partial [Microbispora rosea]|uniref:tetratricopeptide repeat protein n=1 Tax=Microbispora rosea TaxID=58117 RepID=UPI0037BAF3DD